MKSYIIYGIVGVVLLLAALIGALPMVARDQAVKSCVAQMDAQSAGNTVLQGVDKPAYCGCMADEMKKYGKMQPEILETCMTTYIKPQAMKVCETSMRADVEKMGRTMDCECFFAHMVQQAQGTLTAGVRPSDADIQKSTMGVLQNCIK